MKVQNIIGNYCQLYGVAMPTIDLAQTLYFVTFSADGASVFYMHKASALLGRIVGEAMKRGTVLYVHNGCVKPLSWDTWKQTYAQLFAPKPRKKNTPTIDLSAPYRSVIFETMQPKRPAKRAPKQGFERTLSANQTMNALSHPYENMRVESL